MAILESGSVRQKLMLASGLVLFAFTATHFLNHAVGLVSLEAMHDVQHLRWSVTRSWPDWQWSNCGRQFLIMVLSLPSGWVSPQAFSSQVSL